MAFPCAFFPTAAALLNGSEIHGWFRTTRDASARHHARNERRAFAGCARFSSCFLNSVTFHFQTVHSNTCWRLTAELETVPRGTADPIAIAVSRPSNHAIKDEFATPVNLCWFSQL